MKNIIVGIDPGTTVGYAVLDTHGEILDISSHRGLSMSDLIARLSVHGLPLLIGTDKKSVPALIKKVNASVGAKIVAPKNDLSISDKKNFSKQSSNDHERDSLAAAYHAYKSVRKTISKIDEFLTENGKKNLRFKLIRLLVLGDMSLRTGMSILESTKKKDKETVEKIMSQQDFRRDYLRLLVENRALQEHRKVLQKKLALMKPVKKVEEIVVDQKLEDSIKNKDKMITRLRSRSDNHAKEVSELKRQISELKTYLIKGQSLLVMRVMHDLGRDADSDFKDGEIIYVKNPGVWSRKVLDAMKNRVEAVVAPSVKGPKDITILDSKDLNIVMLEDIAIADRKLVMKSLDKKEVLKRIISDYRK